MRFSAFGGRGVRALLKGCGVFQNVPRRAARVGASLLGLFFVVEAGGANPAEVGDQGFWCGDKE